MTTLTIRSKKKLPFEYGKPYQKAVSFLYKNDYFFNQFRTSFWLTPLPKRIPVCQSPLPAALARFSPLLPNGLETDVQKGMTFLPAKLWFSTKV